MYEFVKLERKERSQAFRIASEKLGYPAYVIEKDFWVTYILDTLFNRINHKHRVLFKGGTSLSKCYKLIDRFSEDIDLSLHMADLGFEGDKAPHIVATKESKSASKRAVEDLKVAGEVFLENTILVLLKEKIIEDLGVGEKWSLLLDDTNAENLLFHYPKSLEDDEYGNKYVKPVVLIETGTKSEHIPSEDIEVNSLLEDAIAEIHSKAVVKVLSPKRTFWEKATLLHAENNINRVERVKERLSRHLYDIVMLSRSSIGVEAMKDLALLDTVAKHKAFYYRSNAAKYDEAKVGTLKIVPKGEILEAFRIDYEKMRSMFAGEVIEFDVIIEELRILEDKINN
ncbi:nucleotidyl transferase AbiEii/AbiGii toxin family protein [Sulfurimonas sp.]|uniref:nucleotidyl transferase AbiEii/AbiGii toxin family protein n=1 Tax=Sulfurimonas sp. TaxID=2022749 RepID=UPI003561D32D